MESCDLGSGNRIGMEWFELLSCLGSIVYGDASMHGVDDLGLGHS